MARGGGRGRIRRPIQFADGTNAWEPLNQQEDVEHPPDSGVHQQEQPNSPVDHTPMTGTMETGTSGGPAVQPEEQIGLSQLMQLLVQQQTTARTDIIRIVEAQQQQQQLMQQQQQFMQHLLQQQGTAQQQQGVGTQHARQITLIDFKKYAPPVFKGTADPMEAEGWLKAIEKVFQALRCPAEEKVNFATFMLQDEAANWWDMELGKLGPNDAPFTWEGFRRVYYEKYFPQSVQFQKF